ncbi:hypothetical protein EYF80_049077 [Liparis tanakae]|uniref:Uncharacterized protein n=1 Tax=Liparis tanakae TaxID=230148 RepID=A0A4Z2FKF4_9TELE|nr:hypothetical protein EYF80_049077 [Liparis tanakae]
MGETNASPFSIGKSPVHKVKPTFPRPRMSDPGGVSKPRLVGLKAAALFPSLPPRRVAVLSPSQS